MKKSIVLIALTLIMIASVFATTQNGESLPKDAKNTPVAIDLDKKSKYQYGVVARTVANIDEVTDVITPYNGEIVLTRVEITEEGANKGKYKLSTNESYKIQYLFYEYEAVKLNVTVSGDMEYKKTETTSNNDQETTTTTLVNTIPFKLSIASGTDKVISGGTKETTKDIDAVVINSNDTDSTALTKTIVEYDATDLLGCARMADLNITVGPVGTETLDSKEIGKYVATITLQAVSK